VLDVDGFPKAHEIFAGNRSDSTTVAEMLGVLEKRLGKKKDGPSSDAPFGIQQGCIFDAVLHAGGTVRNYGFRVNNIGSIGTIAAPVSDPFGVGIIQVTTCSAHPIYLRGCAPFIAWKSWLRLKHALKLANLAASSALK
jgi:hypothetical protein